LNIISNLIDYFSKNPIRLLYLIGGTRGVWYWINQWRDRVRIRIKIIEEKPFISRDLVECSTMQCEVENLGSRPTSLRKTVRLTGYTPQGEFKPYEGKIASSDRDLQSHKPKLITVDFKAENLVFLLFRKYVFRPTRGFYKKYPSVVCKSARMWTI